MVLKEIPQPEVQAPRKYNSRATINASIAVVFSVKRHSISQWHENNIYRRALLNLSCHFRVFLTSPLGVEELAVALPPLSSNIILPLTGSENLPCARYS